MSEDRYIEQDQNFLAIISTVESESPIPPLMIIALATERGPELVERGLAIVTGLVPLIGYDKAAEIAKRAAKEGKTVREIAEETTDLSAEQLDAGLDPFKMTEPSS